MKSNIGMIGVGVMGENLALNMERNGFRVSLYDINHEAVAKLVNGRAKGLNMEPTYSLMEFVESLETPRIIMIMIKAGSPVDETIEKLKPILEKGDIIIDGGNSNYKDTVRRAKDLEAMGLRFVGMGVSGGEEGALNGPSLMPGGSLEAWEHIQRIYQAIAAKIDGEACCKWMGASGAGHYVKMIHNGIEYGDMQLICETYDIMRKLLGVTPDEMSKVFEEWNQGKLSSYLIEITGEILKYKDTDGTPLINKILDTAGQKGTGKWASQNALDEGIPLTLITEAVYARCLSAIKNERVIAAKEFSKKDRNIPISLEFVKDLENALYAAKIISYAQGFSLLKEASRVNDWGLDFGGIALVWRNGCIIRSQFLGKIYEAFTEDKDLMNLMLAPYFKEELEKSIPSLRKVLCYAIRTGVAVPALSSALAYFDGYTEEFLPQNLLQAQRDYFGAHTYERVDDERGKFHHTNWTGNGGDTTSSSYNA